MVLYEFEDCSLERSIIGNQLKSYICHGQLPLKWGQIYVLAGGQARVRSATDGSGYAYTKNLVESSYLHQYNILLCSGKR